MASSPRYFREETPTLLCKLVHARAMLGQPWLSRERILLITLSCILLHPTSPTSLGAVSSDESPTFRTLHFHQAAPLHRAAHSGLGMATKEPWLQNDTAGGWNSQVGQDWTIERLFRDVRGAPYFVDLAANHAIHLSNSRALERDHGWGGLCIEGNDRLVFELLRHRTCTVVTALAGGATAEVPVSFDVNTDDGYSRVGAAHHGHRSTDATGSAYTVPLANILRQAGAPNVIHYLSLGSEEAVLQGLLHGVEFTFLAITIERPNAKAQHWLLERNYTHALDHGWFGDQLWLHPDIPNGVAAATALSKAHAHGWVDWYCSRGYWLDMKEHQIGVHVPLLCAKPNRLSEPGRVPPESLLTFLLSSCGSLQRGGQRPCTSA